MIKEYGEQTADKIQIRMIVLRSANNLDLVPKTPPDRCHQLTNNRKETFAVDLKHPFRLIFKPDMEEIPKLSDGGIDLKEINVIKILGVEDYH